MKPGTIHPSMTVEWSVRTRFAQCKPQSHTYASMAQALHYNV